MLAAVLTGYKRSERISVARFNDSVLRFAPALYFLLNAAKIIDGNDRLVRFNNLKLRKLSDRKSVV